MKSVSTGTSIDSLKTLIKKTPDAVHAQGESIVLCNICVCGGKWPGMESVSCCRLIPVSQGGSIGVHHNTLRLILTTLSPQIHCQVICSGGKVLIKSKVECLNSKKVKNHCKTDENAVLFLF